MLPQFFFMWTAYQEEQIAMEGEEILLNQEAQEDDDKDLEDEDVERRGASSPTQVIYLWS